MAKNKNIRSKYIKNLIGESKEISKELEETTKQTLKDILKETVNAEFKSILSEAANEDYEEEEVNADNEPVAGAQADPNTVGNAETETPETTETPELEGGMESAGMAPEMEAAAPVENEEEGEADDIWNSLEQYKGADGEYDLTGMDAQSAARVLKVMDPEKDGIRVVKDGNKVELTDDNNDAEYIIELEPEEENVYDIEMEPTMAESENHGNVGYTDNYQKKTAMTTPDNHEPSPMKGYRDWDKGAPHGTEKPWAGKGNSKPYGKKTDDLEEGIIIEMETECGEMESAMTMSNKRTDREPNGEDNGHDRMRRHRNKTGVNPTMNASENRSDEAIKRKANEIFLENKELKKVASKIKARLEESYLMNYNLGKIVKIITENSTTRDEKINIVNRFSDVKSIEESKNLYETISRELASTKTTNNVDNVVNGGQMVNESRQFKPSVVETSMYRSTDLHETLDLMERMDRLGK